MSTPFTPPDASPRAAAGAAWLTGALVVANIAVFAAMAVAGAGVLRPEPLVHIAWGSNFAPLTAGGQWWRLASSTFLHFGALHLLFNMWALWTTGGLVERLFGHGRFVAIYAVCGVVGSLASIAWNPLVNSAGASGAIFGVIGAQLGFFMRDGHRIPAAVIRSQRNSTLGFIAYAVIFGLTVPGIDNAAHLGGLASGTALGWLLARPLGSAAGRRRGGAGLLVAGLLAAGLLYGGGQLASRAADARAPEQSFLLERNRYATAEVEVLAGMNRVMTAARAGALDDAGVVAWLEDTGIPFYRDAEQRFASASLPPASPLVPDRARTLAFVRRRLAGLELFSAGIRHHDRARLERALAELGLPDAGGDGSKSR